MSIFEDEAAKEIIQEFKEVAEASEIIYGQGASKGRISGIVKIIPVDYSDLSQINAEIEKMKKGEILVAETTAPELLVACNKARAIITDMGGLMSHAAIVSREFNIPCVVATKNASKILKDGDKVEVDGDSGIVRVLKK
jgi:pyruvate,water dikinase